MIDSIIKKDIAIIGAGIIGCSIARELSKFNKSIIVIEKEYDVTCGATKANSGIIHAGYAEKLGTLRSSLCHKGNILFRKNSKELDISIKNIGSLVSIKDKSQLNILEKLLVNGKKNGIQNIEIIIGSEKIKKIEPNIIKNVYASLYAKEACIALPYEAAFALFENAKINNVEFFFNSEVKDINYNKSENKFYIETQGFPIEAEVVINCAGLFADKIANMIGDYSFSITPFRGEYIIFDEDTNGFVNTINFVNPGELICLTLEKDNFNSLKDFSINLNIKKLIKNKKNA